MRGSTRRITFVADELLGYTRTGGLGTATSFLAVALGRIGHAVEFLYVGRKPDEPMADEWQRVYDEARVAIRHLDRSDEVVEPAYFATTHDVELALAADPPDVVIAQDLAAPAYAPLRLRQLGLGFSSTLFVVYCHGGRRWITDTARKVRVLPGAHAITMLEQACVELADIVVSPSAYLVEWMRNERWTLPADTRVIPYLTRAVATGEPAPRAESGAAVERLTFFGRLEERKGLKPFAAALNALEPDLLRRVELEFVGAATPAWPRENIEALLDESTKRSLRAISFHTGLDQPDALAKLSRRGTLVVMPSLGETFSNAVYECLERGIPFLASDAGAPRELVADEDRARVLFEPTERGIENALRAALTSDATLRPARAALDPQEAYEHWANVVGTAPVPREGAHTDDSSAWTLVGDVDADVQATLARAQRASGADVVTCGITLPSGARRFFLGDPGGLGVLENHYGTVALIKDAEVGDPTEPIWQKLARLAVDGASIVSIPKALVAQASPPASVATSPRQALAVARIFDRRLPPSLRSLARLTVGLAAQQERVSGSARPVRSFVRRLVRR
jgi:glycosyltransferase involved in cell wall biosynthesis